jgi:hypothetical protein
LLAIAPQAAAFLLMVGGFAVLSPGIAIFEIVLAIAFVIAVLRQRAHISARADQPEDERDGFDWERWLHRERHLLALFELFFAACMVGFLGLTLGTVLILCGLLVSVTSLYTYAPWMYATVSRWEPE